MNSLITNQELALKKLSRLKIGALFMEMGTGKTKVASDLIDSKKGKIDKILWFCPFTAKKEIEKEIQKWHSELVVEMIGLESLGSSDNLYVRLLDLVKTHRTFIVVDESIKIKNNHAKRTTRLIELGKYATYKLILNGTPLARNVLDVWSQFEFLSPKILNMDFREFKNNYAEYYIRGRLKGLVKKQHNIPHLVSLVKPYIFDSQLEINKNKNYYDYFYANSLNTEYQKEKDEFLEKIKQFENVDFLAIANKLQKIYTTSNEKTKLIDEILKNNHNDQFIIFIKFVRNKGEVTISGDTPEAERNQIINDFKNGKIRVLYMTYGVGTFSLNLQNCHHMIFADQTYDYGQKVQAEYRIYRMNQQHDVHYYNLWCKIGLEVMIQMSLEKKTNLLDEIKRTIKEVGEKQWLKYI